MKNKICGIYAIKNKLNNKMYIGSSIDIKKRWKQHKNLLKNNKHHSKKLQSAWNLSSAKNFEFKIIEETKIKNLLEKEDLYINKYNTFFNGYNMTEGVYKFYKTHKKYRKKIRQEKYKIEYAELKELCENINFDLYFDIAPTKVRRIIRLIEHYTKTYQLKGYKIIKINSHHSIPSITVYKDNNNRFYLSIYKNELYIEYPGKNRRKVMVGE